MSAKTENWLNLAQLMAGTEASLVKFLQANHGISLTEFLALDILASAENEELRMQDLSSRLQLNQSSVTRLVERLERLGLTKRDSCPNDKRGVYTVLIEGGRDKLRKARPDYEKHILSALNSQEIQAALRGLLS